MTLIPDNLANDSEPLKIKGYVKKSDLEVGNSY